MDSERAYVAQLHGYVSGMSTRKSLIRRKAARFRMLDPAPAGIIRKTLSPDARSLRGAAWLEGAPTRNNDSQPLFTIITIYN
jgi:hypothetical protein